MTSNCCSSFCTCFWVKIWPYSDFLHPTTTYETKKITKYSKLGFILFILFLATFVILFNINNSQSIKNPSISYYQDFIRKKEFVGKKVTLGFNVSDEWKDQVIFTLYNQDDEIVKLSICDENLEESENLTYYCIINYSIQKNNLSSYSLKLHLNLTRKVEKEVKVPFSISMREPNINHTNEKNPLDIFNEKSINKFRCFFNTKEITSYRRYLKLINYISHGGYNFDDKEIDELYLDDFEDSRKMKKNENSTDENFLGSYRILLSKKIDIYERKYDDFFTLVSKVFSYYGLIMLVFTILIKIFVYPNDSLRIYEALEKENRAFTKEIFDSFPEKKKLKMWKNLKIN